MTFTVNTYDNMHREYTFQDDGKIITKATQDCNPTLDYCKRMRDNEAQNQLIGDKDIHYASIPVVVVEELMKKGINIFDRNCWKDFKREIETNYSYLKTTNLKGW